MKRRLSLWLLFHGLCLPSAALADAVDDVVRGTNLRFVTARVQLEGETYTVGEWGIPKAAGTLNLSVPLAHFGLSHPGVLHLTGTRAGSRITWSIDQALSPEYRSGDTRVQRVRGQLVAEARLVRGADAPTCGGAPCAYNVRLFPGPGSWIRVSGCHQALFCWGFERAISVGTFVGFGGLPRPRLASMTLDLPASRCSSQSAITGAGRVHLQSPAPAGGALVTLRSTDPSRVNVTSVRVPAGRTSERFAVTLQPFWAGTARVTAAAGGMVRSQLVDVRGCGYLAWPSILRQLALPGHVLALFDGGRALVQTKTGTAMFDWKAQTAWDLSKKLGLGDVQLSAFAPNGELVGTGTTPKGEPVAFRWSVHDAAPTLYAGVAPLAVTPLAVGLAVDPKSGALVRMDDLGVAKLPKLEGVQVLDARGDTNGRFAATVLMGQEPRAALLDASGVKLLSQGRAAAVDLTAAGTVVGHAQNAKGHWQPFVWSAKQGFAWRALPPGCTSATVVDTNDSGWFVGTAYCEKQRPRPFLADPAGKLVPVEALTKSEDVFEHVIGIDEENAVLLQARTPNGATVFHLLHP